MAIVKLALLQSRKEMQHTRAISQLQLLWNWPLRTMESHALPIAEHC
jgi:hypothetical protein